MVAAVKHCHERKISHRDLKPENFLLSERVSSESDTPNIKLIDFDLAFQWNKSMKEEVKKK